MYHLRTHIARVVAGALIAIGLAACGQTASQASLSIAAPKLDSCALLTKSDAETLLGEPVGAPSTNDVGAEVTEDERAVSHCLYSATGDALKSVSVLVRRGATGEDARDGLEQIRNANVMGGTFDTVKGVGAAAIWNHGGSSEQLNIAQDQYLIITSARLGKGVSTFDASKAIAQRVLERLK